MVCLVCQKKVPLLKRLAGEEFCSPEHKSEYASLQSSAALARLMAYPRARLDAEKLPPRRRPVYETDPEQEKCDSLWIEQEAGAQPIGDERVVSSSPRSAAFVSGAFDVSQPGSVVAESRYLGEPLPIFTGLMLRRNLDIRYTVAHRFAGFIAGRPEEMEPGAASWVGFGDQGPTSCDELPGGRMRPILRNPIIAISQPIISLRGLRGSGDHTPWIPGPASSAAPRADSNHAIAFLFRGALSFSSQRLQPGKADSRKLLCANLPGELPGAVQCAGLDWTSASRYSFRGTPSPLALPAAVQENLAARAGLRNPSTFPITSHRAELVGAAGLLRGQSVPPRASRAERRRLKFNPSAAAVSMENSPAGFVPGSPILETSASRAGAVSKFLRRPLASIEASVLPVELPPASRPTADSLTPFLATSAMPCFAILRKPNGLRPIRAIAEAFNAAGHSGVLAIPAAAFIDASFSGQFPVRASTVAHRGIRPRGIVVSRLPTSSSVDGLPTPPSGSIKLSTASLHLPVFPARFRQPGLARFDALPPDAVTLQEGSAAFHTPEAEPRFSSTAPCLSVISRLSFTASQAVSLPETAPVWNMKPGEYAAGQFPIFGGDADPILSGPPVGFPFDAAMAGAPAVAREPGFVPAGAFADSAVPGAPAIDVQTAGVLRDAEFFFLHTMSRFDLSPRLCELRPSDRMPDAIGEAQPEPAPLTANQFVLPDPAPSPETFASAARPRAELFVRELRAAEFADGYAVQGCGSHSGIERDAHSEPLSTFKIPLLYPQTPARLNPPSNQAAFTTEGYATLALEPLVRTAIAEEANAETIAPEPAPACAGFRGLQPMMADRAAVAAASLDVGAFEFTPAALDAQFAIGLPACKLTLFPAGAFHRGPGPANLARRTVRRDESAVAPFGAFPTAFPPLGDATWTPRAPIDPVPSLPAAPPLPFREPMWGSLSGAWRHTPSPIRVLALAIPLIVPILYFVSKLGAGDAGSTGHGFGDSIRSRATFNKGDDFRSGLSAWKGGKGWQETWNVDPSGFVQPGRLALYQPTLFLNDYRLEFMGQIEKKSLGFVFRASDSNNYYATKISISRPGPLPSASIIRYAVVNGVAGEKVQLPMPILVRNDTMYRVLVTVEGEHFTTTVNGQMVDAWSDNRLKSGGVGIFSDKGEVARLRWIHVVDKDDFVGWLCSQVSPRTDDRHRTGASHE